MRWHLLLIAHLLLVVLEASPTRLAYQHACAQQAGVEVALRPSPGSAKLPLAGPSGQPLVERGLPPVSPGPTAKQLAADPFQYRVPKGSGGFVPAPAVELPPGIRVLGILVMEDGQSLAALQIPGESEVAYVREDDDLQIRDGTVQNASAAQQMPGKPAGTQPSRPSGAAAAATGSILYLKISKITPEAVVVYPQHSPSNVHVYR